MRVVIIGGGFGGLAAAKKLKKLKGEVILIDKKNHHLFQPLLYQVATAALSPADIAQPLRHILSNQKNARTLMGEVVDVDKTNKSVTLSNGDKISYDALIIATGTVNFYFGNQEFEKHSTGLKTVQDALAIREHILLSFERAERQDNIDEALPFLNFVVIGGGPTGVEMAGSIAEIARVTLFKDFSKIDPKKSKIYLIEGGDRLLPTFPEKLSERAKDDLEKMGVEVIVGKLVQKISDDGVEVNGEFIPAKNVIWAAGNKAHPLLEKLGTKLDKMGRVEVERDFSVTNHSDIFVIGDAAAYLTQDQKTLPGIAPVAIQQGRYVAKALLSKKQSKPFSYKDRGMLSTIGKLHAVGLIGNVMLTGMPAWLVWSFVHVNSLIGHRNRWAVMFEWAFNYFTGARGARLIHSPIDDDKTSSHFPLN